MQIGGTVHAELHLRRRGPGKETCGAERRENPQQRGRTVGDVAVCCGGKIARAFGARRADGGREEGQAGAESEVAAAPEGGDGGEEQKQSTGEGAGVEGEGN